MTAQQKLDRLVEGLRADVPGVTLGYIGNLDPQFDDRSWYIFLPHPGRVGDYRDRIGGYRTSDLGKMVENWDLHVAQVKRRMGVHE